jgi:hypothetical protein
LLFIRPSYGRPGYQHFGTVAAEPDADPSILNMAVNGCVNRKSRLDGSGLQTPSGQQPDEDLSVSQLPLAREEFDQIVHAS